MAFDVRCMLKTISPTTLNCMTKCLGTKSRVTRYPFIAFVGDQINSRINKCVSEGWPANSGQNLRHYTTVGHNGGFFSKLLSGYLQKCLFYESLLDLPATGIFIFNIRLNYHFICGH